MAKNPKNHRTPKGPAKPAPKTTKAKPAKAQPVKIVPAAKPAPVARAPKSSPSMEKPSKKTALRDKLLKRKVATKPIAFSLDEVRAIAKTVTAGSRNPDRRQASKGTVAKPIALERPAKPSHHKAASLADILGFNPSAPAPPRPSPRRTCRRSSSATIAS
jgi:hypothetical protein